MFKLFIKRPILSGVISVIIVCLGRTVYFDTAHHSVSRYRTPICNGNRPIHRG